MRLPQDDGHDDAHTKAKERPQAECESRNGAACDCAVKPKDDTCENYIDGEGVHSRFCSTFEGNAHVHAPTCQFFKKPKSDHKLSCESRNGAACDCAVKPKRESIREAAARLGMKTGNQDPHELGPAEQDMEKRNDEADIEPLRQRFLDTCAKYWAICGWCAGTGQEERTAFPCPKCDGAGGKDVEKTSCSHEYVNQPLRGGWFCVNCNLRR